MPPRKQSKKITLTVKTADGWLLECVEKIVEFKLEMGFKTSVSYEILRLAKKGLVESMEGADLDKKVLKSVHTR